MLVAYHILHFLGDVIVFCFSCCMWFLLIIEHIIGVFFGGQLPIPRWRADKINPISKKKTESWVCLKIGYPLLKSVVNDSSNQNWMIQQYLNDSIYIYYYIYILLNHPIVIPKKSLWSSGNQADGMLDSIPPVGDDLPQFFSAPFASGIFHYHWWLNKYSINIPRIFHKTRLFHYITITD